jgi:hypothetical protein
VPPRWRYDEAAGRYRASSGRFLPASTIRQYLDRTIKNHRRVIDELTEQFRGRDITLGQWERGMRVELKQIHVYSALMAKGGRAQLTQSDYGVIGRRVRDEYEALRARADAVTTGTQAPDGSLAQRARMYANAGRGTFHVIERRDMERRGYAFERNVLGPTDHCAGCVAETARGAVPIGNLVPVGSRTCLTNCQCRIEYERAA